MGITILILTTAVCLVWAAKGMIKALDLSFGIAGRFTLRKNFWEVLSKSGPLGVVGILFLYAVFLFVLEPLLWIHDKFFIKHGPGDGPY